MDKFKEVFYKIMIIFSIIVSIVATVAALGNLYQTTGEVLNPIIIIMGVIVGFYFFIKLFKKLDNVSDKKLNRLAKVLSLVFFITLSIFGVRHLIIPTYDLSHVERELNFMMENGPIITNVGYFGKYTNQVPLTVFLYYIYYIGNLLSIGNLRIFATLINSLFISISAYFTYLSIKEIKPSKYGIIGLLFFILNPIFYMYASYYYTDTLCLPFASIAIYLLLKLYKTNKKSSICLLAITGFIIALGMQIRLVVVFVLIAAIVASFLNNKGIKQTLKYSLCLLVGFILGIINYSLIESNFEIPKDDTRAFPITHWVMMGLNGDTGGRYNQVDHDYTKSFSTKEEKTSANIKVIKTRIKELGPIGLIKLWGQKIALAWSNGAYRYPDKIRIVEKIRADFEYICGCNMIFILYYLQIFKSMIMVVLTYMLFGELKKENRISNIKFIYIAIFGAFLFYSIWEVQARYSLSFLPWFIILFPLGIDNISKIKLKDRLLKIMKYFPYFIFALSIGLLIFNYPKYVVDKNKYVDTRVYQVKNRSEKYRDLNNDKLYQSFIAYDDFNSVSINFIVDDDDDNINYQFRLLDEDYNEVETIIFKKDEVKNNKFKIFRFDTIKVDKEDLYYINVIPLEEATNTIGINSFTYEPYNIYPDGNLYVNGKKTNGSFSFKVELRSKRSYTTPTVYITISVIIIAIEAFALLPIKRKETL